MGDEVEMLQCWVPQGMAWGSWWCPEKGFCETSGPKIKSAVLALGSVGRTKHPMSVSDAE